MKKYPLLRRFSLISLVSFLATGLLLGAVLTYSVERNAIETTKQETVLFVLSEVDRLLSGVDFRFPIAGRRYDELQEKFAHFRFNPSVRRIKVWNRDSVIVWSDDRRLVGKRYPDDRELREALGGEVRSEITSPGKPENRTERGLSKFLELYVPIRSGPSGEVRAVFELYRDLSHLVEEIHRQKVVLGVALLIGYAGTYLLCFGIVWRGARRIAEQTEEIERAEQRSQELAGELTTLINNVPGVVYRGHRDWSLSLIGDAVESMTGYPPERFTGGAIRWKDLIHPEDREGVQGAFREAVRETKKELRVEYRIVHQDGSIRWIADRRQFLYRQDGSFDRVEGLLLDVTERKQAEEALRESEDRYRDLVENSQDLICTHDMEGKLLSVNRAAAERLGYSPEEVLGKNLGDFLAPEARGDFREYLRKIARDGAAEGLMLGLTRTGERRIWQYRNSLRTRGVKAPIVRGMAQDITERWHAEKRLKEMEERFRAVFDGSTDGILLADVESRRFLIGNRAICKMLRATPEEIAQLGVEDIHPREDLPRVLDAFRRQAKGEFEVARDLPVRRRDGSVFVADIKSNPVRIAGREYLIGNFRDVTERKQAEEALSRLSLAVHHAGEAIVMTDPDGIIEYVNPAFERISGYSGAEAIGRNMRLLKSGKQSPEFYRELWGTISAGRVWSGQMTNRRKNGSLYEEEATISPVFDDGGRILNYVAVKRDVTRERALEKQVRTAQRMEAVGTLAGGIAHDFNNALTGILGYGELLRLRLEGNREAQRERDEICRAAEHAATLTRQLLTFARRQVMEPVHLSLGETVGELIRFLSKVVGSHIVVKTSLSGGTPTVRADRGQLEQVLMNLCLNARDAMPHGGQLLIETEAIDIGEEHIRKYPYMKPGRYAQLSVSDTGIGMDEATRERIFEPFFTTKSPDKGTGLGLSVVYGIVKQHRGYIHVYSEPGKGSTFRVYLPGVDAAPDAPKFAAPDAVPGGHETILLAEDEEAIRGLAERVLQEYGYLVLAAKDGEEAVGLFREHGEKIDLALLDVVMPRMGGKDACEKMRETSPDLKVIFMSGYSANAVHEGFVMKPGTPFLGKPFSPLGLARKVRDILDGK